MQRSDPPLVGAHVSIQGGLDKAFFRGREADCRVIQIFTRNTTRWVSKALSTVEIEKFFKAREETSVEPIAAHSSYLINLASPKEEVRRNSFVALLDELERTESLRIPYLVMHPGSHLGDGEKKGLRRIAEALNRIHDQTPDFKTKILLETTAGQGTNLGSRFEQLGEILARTDARDRVDICLDTCHVFAAGYDFSTPDTYRRLIRSFNSTLDLQRLRLLHINDSKKMLGSRVDRHEHLGKGLIGKEGLAFFLTDPMFKHLPFIVETPKGENEEGISWDEVNLDFIRRLVEEKQ